MTASVSSNPTEHSETLESLHTRYAGLVLRTAYLILADWHQAEDVAQDVWIQVQCHLHNYDPAKGAWTTWLHHITVNRCLNVRRRVQRWISETLVPTIASNTPPVLETVLHSEEQKALWLAINHLSTKHRMVIVLRYFNDLSYEEIANVLDCPVGTVRSRLHKAHELLREQLTTNEGDA